jgi:hypothetical protein
VTCPPDTGNTQCSFRSDPQIAPTGTTCQQYRDNQSATFSPVLYTLTKGNPASQVINSVSPGVFFLYDGVALATSGTITVTETDGSWTRAIVVNQLQVILYNLSCTTLHVGTLAVGANGSVTITNVPAGNYILSVKYDPNSLNGYHPPTPSTTYNFAVQANGLASGSGSVTVAIAAAGTIGGASRGAAGSASPQIKSVGRSANLGRSNLSSSKSSSQVSSTLRPYSQLRSRDKAAE